MSALTGSDVTLCRMWKEAGKLKKCTEVDLNSREADRLDWPIDLARIDWAQMTGCFVSVR
jgi:hypothetical protein